MSEDESFSEEEGEREEGREGGRKSERERERDVRESRIAQRDIKLGFYKSQHLKKKGGRDNKKKFG